jgi:hypothetical protein
VALIVLGIETLATSQCSKGIAIVKFGSSYDVTQVEQMLAKPLRITTLESSEREIGPAYINISKLLIM